MYTTESGQLQIRKHTQNGQHKSHNRKTVERIMQSVQGYQNNIATCVHCCYSHTLYQNFKFHFLTSHAQMHLILLLLPLDMSFECFVLVGESDYFIVGFSQKDFRTIHCA